MVLEEVVLEWCATEDDATRRLHSAEDLVLLGEHIFDSVAFIEHDNVRPRPLEQRHRRLGSWPATTIAKEGNRRSSWPLCGSRPLFRGNGWCTPAADER